MTAGPLRASARQPPSSGPADRVTAYVDGFNLYNGMHDARGRKGLWLDLESLFASILRPGQALAAVHYFTAGLDGPSGVRQRTYLEALALHCSSVTAHIGRFQTKRITCRNCHQSWRSAEEKETDVSLGVAMVEHAALDHFDMAMLVSADSDMCPAVRAVKRIDNLKRVVAVFPPRRSSVDLAAAVDGVYRLGDRVPERHQLPNPIVRMDGSLIERPAYWQ